MRVLVVSHNIFCRTESMGKTLIIPVQIPVKMLMKGWMGIKKLRWDTYEWYSDRNRIIAKMEECV